MIAGPENNERAIRKTFFVEHLEHRAERVVESPHIRVIAGEFAADVRQVFEKAGRDKNFLRLYPAARRLAARDPVLSYR